MRATKLRFVLLCLSATLYAQTPPPAPPPAQNAQLPGVLVDQAIAVVNGYLILESDIDEERRFDAFQPFRDTTGSFSRSDAIDRLIDRALILQQASLQPDDDVTLAEARTQLQALRAEIPACEQYRCTTDAGWQKFIHDHGFTLPELEDRWRERMQILRFIEDRFRSGIRISPQEIKAFYDNKLLPEYRAQKATAPPLDSLSDRIQEILLQKQVGNLLVDWLQTLKAQGSVRIMKPGEVAP